MKRGQVIEREFEPALTDDRLALYAVIAERAAAQLRRPGAHTAEGVSLTHDDKSIDLWSPHAVKHDALGWVIKEAALVLHDTDERRSRCMKASSHIGQRIHECTGHSMIEINDTDTNGEAVAQALEQSAKSFRAELAERHAPRRSRLYG